MCYLLIYRLESNDLNKNLPQSQPFTKVLSNLMNKLKNRSLRKLYKT